MNDTYKTVKAPANGLFKDRGSRFLSFVYPVEEEEEIRQIIQKIKKEHHGARHYCFAWRLGQEEIRSRANDDGEPSGTAGKPMLTQLTAYDLTQVLLVVVRYFGGVLLGTSGLIHAYREASMDALRNATVITKVIETRFRLDFPYQELNGVMHILKTTGLTYADLTMGDRCSLLFTVRKADAGRILSSFGNLSGTKTVQADDVEK